MFTLALQAMIVVATASESPISRAEALLKNTNGFSTSIEVSVSGLGTAVGRYSVRRPAMQRMELKGANADEVFTQGGKATVHIDRSGSEYTWYPAFKVVADPPEESSPMMKCAIPTFLAVGTLVPYGPKEKWRSVGTEIVAGHQCDVVTMPSGPKPTDIDPVRLWIDSVGRIIRVKTVVPSQGGYLTSITTMLDPTLKAPPESAFDEKIPWGYLPTKSPQIRMPRSTGEAAQIGALTELPSMRSVTLDSKQPTVVMVTSDDLAPTGDLGKWRPLADRIKKAKVRFVQVWIGSKPHSSTRDWPSYWDMDGSFEDTFGPPVTPTFYLIVDNALVSAWQGWADDDTDAAATSLLGPLADRH